MGAEAQHLQSAVNRMRAMLGMSDEGEQSQGGYRGSQSSYGSKANAPSTAHSQNNEQTANEMAWR
jgi:hypothetical protein